MTTVPFTRKDGRAVDELRPVTMTRHWLDHAEGSVLVTFGRTRVLCAASFTEGVPRWRKGSGEGWVTAEYAMLPRAGSERSGREAVRGKGGGRTPDDGIREKNGQRLSLNVNDALPLPRSKEVVAMLQEQLNDVLDTLSEREAGVVSMRFGLTDGQPKTLDEIGKVYGVTRERIRQIESKTMSKLRHPSRSQVLRDYLD